MKHITLILMFAFGLVLSAQTTEIANVNFTKVYGETDQGLDYNTNVFDASLLLGFDLNEKSIVFFRPSYQQRILDGASNLRLYKPEFIAGLSQDINDTWNYRVFGLARLASDFEDTQSDHIQYGGGLLFTYTKNENLKWKIGAYARNQPNGVLAFPFLGLDYTFGNDRWNLNALLPQYANLKYALTTDKLYTGLRVSFLTEQYSLSNLPNGNYAELTQFQSELYAEYYLTKSLVTFVKGGLYNYQKYEVFNSSELLLNPGFDEVNDVYSITFGLAYRILTN